MDLVLAGFIVVVVVLLSVYYLRMTANERALNCLSQDSAPYQSLIILNNKKIIIMIIIKILLLLILLLLLFSDFDYMR